MFPISRKKSKPTVLELQTERAELNRMRRKILLSFSETDCEVEEKPPKKNGSVPGEPMLAEK